MRLQQHCRFPVDPVDCGYGAPGSIASGDCFTKVKTKLLFGEHTLNFSLPDKDVTKLPRAKLFKIAANRAMSTCCLSFECMATPQRSLLLFLAELDENPIGGETGPATEKDEFVHVPNPRKDFGTLFQGMVC
ncbi:hypothetical protein KL910_005338 [Ogataea haglerorum]|nr:hypothetical protein KL945_005369 [Ogataea haglerorum]KAG7784064.1 hypothetical protein KL910_005338 [Ogataea haglerorum]